ncbi:MAG TPA: thermonuclease family protein, partial [Alphaproteobacteria bacterium]|nr:thermonuclease family protein [Alphaproteobacteria bacterium]
MLVRIFLALVLVFSAATAQARDDLMPPPQKAPRTPVEVHTLDGDAPASSDPHEFEGKGQAVDAERIMLQGKEIRLFGVVTPALNSSFGPPARQALDKMLGDSNVLCKVNDRDRDGRLLAFCGTVKIPDLSYEMLRQGWAMVDRRALKGNTLSQVYEKAEQEAQAQNRGIFAPAPMAMTVPVSDPAKATTAPVVEAKPAPAAKAEQPAPAAAPAPAPVATAPAPAPVKETAPLPDLHVAFQKLAPAAAPAAEEARPAASAPADSRPFAERYQILLGALILLLASGIYSVAMLWREKQ